MLPKALVNLIDELGSLPGVGSRTAERYAYFLLRSDESTSQRLAAAIDGVKRGVKLCPKTFALINADEAISSLYSDSRRDKTLIAVVEEPFDVLAIERTGGFKGTYHVLGGVLSPIEGVSPEQLHIPQLIARLKEDDVQEIILATNSSVEGESTALFVQRQIKEAGLEIKVSRLARGIPIGVDLEYTDQMTLSHALEGRKTL